MMEFDPVLVHDWLSRSARRFPDKAALICQTQCWTYSTLDSLTSQLAQGLVQTGVKRGDRVIILMNNCAEAVAAMYATLKAGGVFVILADSIKGAKLGYIIDNSGAQLIIAHVSKSLVIQDALSNHKKKASVIWVGPQNKIPKDLQKISLSWEDLIDLTPNVTSLNQNQTDGKTNLPPIIDVDLAALIYTSGSTGEPKGVMSTHHNIVSAARSIIQYVNNAEDDIILDVLPLSFDYGLYQVIMAFIFGGTVVLEKSFLFSHQVLQQIAREKITGFPIVPTIAAMMLKMKELSKYDFSSLRYITNTGAALPIDHIRRLRNIFPHINIISMFGLTECKRVCYLPPEELDRHPSSVGRAMPNSEVAIVDSDGREVKTHHEGELVIRGSNVMQGYWGDSELTDQNYRKGNYPADRILYSGDNFRRDEQGFLYFLGRKDDMIKSRGERISAKEVENVLCGIPGIAEAVVIGVTDEILGQAIKAFVVLSSDNIITEREILKYCISRMENFMVPKSVEILTSLPKTDHGKIDKKQLKIGSITKYGSKRKILTQSTQPGLRQGNRKNNLKT